MANPRPKSMITSSTVFDETNENLKRKSLTSYGHSSSSSIDSGSGKNVNINGQNSSPQNLQITTSSTTTDSDFESEQDDSLQSQQTSKTDSTTANRLERRNKHFHKLFNSEISNKMPDLIDSYVCAYQGDILLQGKMYITDRYLCFHSRIINYVTKHVYRWEQIENITKERVAFIFPTAIGIQLKSSGKKIIYASFITRDQAFEKIRTSWSKFSNENHSYDGEEDDDIAQDGTLKATNMNGGTNSSARRSYDFTDETEQDVLKMCLKPSEKRPASLQPKSSDEKQSSKKSEKKSSGKVVQQDSKRTSEKNDSNQTTRTSRYTKRETKSTEKSKRSSSRANQRSESRHRTSSRTDENQPSIPSSTDSNSLESKSNSSGILNQIISFFNQIYQSLATLTPSYRIQTAIIISLVLIFLFLHSFYLIKLAFRIENRLQSLNYQWPSSSSPVKNSISSNSKEL